MSGENWLGNGDCTTCRRQSYCKKWCSAKNKRREMLVTQIARQAFAEVLCRIPKAEKEAKQDG